MGSVCRAPLPSQEVRNDVVSFLYIVVRFIDAMEEFVVPASHVVEGKYRGAVPTPVAVVWGTPDSYLAERGARRGVSCEQNRVECTCCHECTEWPGANTTHNLSLWFHQKLGSESLKLCQKQGKTSWPHTHTHPHPKD